MTGSSSSQMTHRVGVLLVLVLGFNSRPGVVVDASEVAVCPGESARYGDHKCNHDPTHRVCAQLLDKTGQPEDWGADGNFWQITGQEAFQWDEQIRQNGGQDWCICMWATAGLINKVGCENVHLNCEATDVSYVMKAYSDGGTDLTSAHKCLAEKCGAQVTSLAEQEDLGSGNGKTLRGESFSGTPSWGAAALGLEKGDFGFLATLVLGTLFILGVPRLLRRLSRDQHASGEFARSGEIPGGAGQDQTPFVAPGSNSRQEGLE